MEETNIKTEDKKPQNPLLEEVRAERERLEKARDEAKAQADRLEQLRADQLLSGTAGIRPEIKEVISEQELKKRQAVDFWKGTPIADAIERENA